MKRGIVAGFLCVLLAVAGSASAEPAPCPQRGIFEIYDTLMPVRAAHTGPDVQTVTVRYIPGDTSRQSEAKVIIREHADGSLSVEIWRPRGKSIQQQFRDLRAARPGDCDDALALTIEIEHVQAKPERFQRLYREFQKLRVPVAVEPAIYLDTPRVDVMTEGPMNGSSFTLYGPSVAEKRPHALIRWATSLITAAMDVK